MCEDAGLSYQAIRRSWRRILSANCPHEAGTVNSQVHLVMLVGPSVSVQADSVNAAVTGMVWQILLCYDDRKSMLQVSMDSHVLLFEHLDSVHVCSCILPTQSRSHRALNFDLNVTLCLIHHRALNFDLNITLCIIHQDL